MPLLLVGTLLFGAGIGNATSLPPLIAQVEFVRDEVARVVSLIVAVAQAGYAFAPAAFGLIRKATAAPDYEPQRRMSSSARRCSRRWAIGALLIGRAVMSSGPDL